MKKHMKKCIAFIVSAVMAGTSLSALAQAEPTAPYRLHRAELAQAEEEHAELAQAEEEHAELLQTEDFGYYIDYFTDDDGNEYEGIVIHSCNHKLETVQIPSEIDGMPVVGIENNVFYGKYIKKIIIPETVKEFTYWSIEYCPNLEAIEVSKDNPYYCSEGGVLFDKDKTELIRYPLAKSGTSYTIPSTVEAISRGAFDSCDKLEAIEIPSSVTQIEESAFSYLYSLTSINVAADNENYSSEGGVLFDKEKTKLICYPPAKSGKSYTIPDIATKIGRNAFTNCTALESITIPDSVTEIGYDAFSYCTALKTAVLSKSITKIPHGMFEGCASLTDITIPDNITEIGRWAFSDCTALPSIKIPDNVTEIGYSAFFDCRALKTALLPKSITEIPHDMFSGCESLTGITIPDSVAKIGENAFRKCTSLPTVTIPSSVTQIGVKAFSYCTKLTALNVPESDYFAVENGILFNKDKTAIICYPAGKTDASYTIPTGVQSINGAFAGCPSLKKVEIPEGMKIIGNYAFSDCTALASITIPEGVEKIRYYAFAGCKSLPEITIPSTVETISDNAFRSCESLKDIKVDAQNKTFINTDGVLFDIYSGKLICYPAAKAGSSYTIPTGVISLDDGAFYKCKNLKTVYIPKTVKHIEYEEFWNGAVTDVYYEGTEEELSYTAFGDYIQNGSENIYDEEFEDEDIDNDYIDKRNIKVHYNQKNPNKAILPEPIVEIAEPGIYIDTDVTDDNGKPCAELYIDIPGLSYHDDDAISQGALVYLVSYKGDEILDIAMRKYIDDYDSITVSTDGADTLKVFAFTRGMQPLIKVHTQSLTSTPDEGTAQE